MYYKLCGEVINLARVAYMAVQSDGTLIFVFGDNCSTRFKYPSRREAHAEMDRIYAILRASEAVPYAAPVAAEAGPPHN